MSGPNLNLDFDPLEGPSTRIWKPQEPSKEFGLEDVAIYVNKFMDNIFALRANKDGTPAAAEDCRKDTILETGSESGNREESGEDEDVSENSSVSKFRSMKIDQERLHTLRSLARELGSRMPSEQRLACGSLFHMALRKDLFSTKPGQLEKLQQMMGEIGEKMPTEQRMTFGLLCNVAMKRFKEHAKLREETVDPELD